ncbi:MAG TPA: hypothetical protein VIL20_02360 [Sandaracinaceae bacterium]
MSEAPERCPTCGTSVPDGAPRCPGCGRIFGEQNRCPHCHAIAAVIRRGAVTVCAACGKPRAGTVVLGGGPGSIVPVSAEGRRASTSAMLRKSKGRALRSFGVLALASGVLGATLAAAAIPGAIGLALAVVAAVIGVGVGALSMRAGARSLREGERDDRRAREAAVLELAQKRGGALTATEVARELGLALEEADRLLTSMVGDGTRVGVEVDDEGIVRYVFRELAPPPAARVRVETEPADHDEEAELARSRAARSDARTER